jgi:hypothetical protein
VTSVPCHVRYWPQASNRRECALSGVKLTLAEASMALQKLG